MKQETKLDSSHSNAVVGLIKRKNIKQLNPTFAK